jgi:MarR-like DNA-binding transcriptional regulator SgrR of sgrS sRNA
MSTNNGILERTFGGVTAKVLDFLIVHREYDYSKQDIANYSKVSLRHAILSIEKLEKLDIIKRTRNVGAAHMYQLNLENEITTAFTQCIRKIAAYESLKNAEQLIKNGTTPPIQQTTPNKKIIKPQTIPA